MSSETFTLSPSASSYYFLQFLCLTHFIFQWTPAKVWWKGPSSANIFSLSKSPSLQPSVFSDDRNYVRTKSRTIKTKNFSKSPPGYHNLIRILLLLKTETSFLKSPENSQWTLICLSAVGSLKKGLDPWRSNRNFLYSGKSFFLHRCEALINHTPEPIPWIGKTQSQRNRQFTPLYPELE